MDLEGKLLFDINVCKDQIASSNFENFLAYKNLFKLVFEASNNLPLTEFKQFCKDNNISPYQAKSYYTVYDKLFNSTITEYKISEELAKRAKHWDKDTWIEFSKLYDDGLACRKILFYALVSSKLKYSDICIPIEEVTIKDIKKYRQYINKYRPNKYKNTAGKFRGLRTRLSNFINKDFRAYVRADKDLMNMIQEHNNNLIALIEEHLEHIEQVDTNEPEEIEEIPQQEINMQEEDTVEITHYTRESKIDLNEWLESVSKYIDTDIYRLYNSGNKLKVNWNNPYYAVIFLGLDAFNLPSRDEYRRRYRELIMLFHPDNKSAENKNMATLLMTILNDINLQIWGSNGERYMQFETSIKFSLMQLGV